MSEGMPVEKSSLSAPQSSLYEQMGGEKKLRPLIEDFVGQIFDDIMIGFLFRHARRERIIEMEFQFAARHLGANLAYTGKPLREAHAPHPIVGGHFLRRLQILKQTMRAHKVSDAVFEHWVAHTESLRSLITRDGDHCDHQLAGPG